MELKNYVIQYDLDGIPRFAMGEVYGNPKFKDGTSIMTSNITEYVEGEYILTKNSKYLLKKD